MAGTLAKNNHRCFDISYALTDAWGRSSFDAPNMTSALGNMWPLAQESELFLANKKPGAEASGFWVFDMVTAIGSTTIPSGGLS